jgi:hypothetical protein
MRWRNGMRKTENREPAGSTEFYHCHYTLLLQCDAFNPHHEIIKRRYCQNT